jgi:ABC-type transport system substrate-binding protein
MVACSKTPFFRASWLADYPDAENYAALFYSKGFSPNGPNYTHYNNSNFDSLYLKSFSTFDTEKRKKIFEEMENILANDAVIIPLFYDVAIRVVNKNVQKMTINPVNNLVLKNVKKSK